MEHHHRHHHHRHHKRALRKGVPQPDAGADYGQGTKNAVIRMNEMFLETQMKWDESAIRCEARIKELGHLLEEIAEDLKTFSVASSEAAGRKDDAFAAINA